MPRIEITCNYDCPYCYQGFEMGSDGIFIDDIDDNCTTTCDECGGVFQLRCVSVEVKMEATKVPSDSVD